MRVSFYQAVPGQTDSDPGTASCGKNLQPWVQVALSRDLFYREDGSKRCGERVEIVLDTPVKTTSGRTIYRVRGVVWDTMHPRFTRAVDVLVGVHEPALRYGVVHGRLR